VQAQSLLTAFVKMSDQGAGAWSGLADEQDRYIYKAKDKLTQPLRRI